MDDLREAIKTCVERLDRYRRSSKRINEQDTKAGLIEPIVQALGWDRYDPDEVNREYRRRGTDNPVDYALLLLRTPRLFIEAKGVGENINDPRWANQTISYATVAGVEWVVLTDGAQWRIYNAHAPVPVEDKLFRSVDLGQDPDGAAEVLGLLSKENMRENRIQELWQSYFVDRQIHAVLTGLFTGSEPPSDLVNLVAKRAERLAKDTVRSSLVRARASFDFPLPNLAETPPSAPTRLRPVSPSPAPEPSPTSTGAPTTPGTSTPASPRTGQGKSAANRPLVSPMERKVKVVDLLRSGRIEPGVITAQYDGQEWQAHVDPAGSVTFHGQPCSSLSHAGALVKLASRGPDTPESVTATDGWDFWSARDAIVGDMIKLKEARRRAAASSPR